MLGKSSIYNANSQPAIEQELQLLFMIEFWYLDCRIEYLVPQPDERVDQRLHWNVPNAEGRLAQPRNESVDRLLDDLRGMTIFCASMRESVFSESGSTAFDE